MAEGGMYASDDAILLVDDEPAQLKSLSAILNKEGLRPVCCETSEEALAVFGRGGINVVILDLRIDGEDGLALLARFRQINPNVKAIIHTAYASLESAVAAVNEEAFAYVRKMGDVDDLLRHVHRAFHEHLLQFRDELKDEVERRTAELIEVNEQLKRDVAARKRAEAFLRESEERYRLLIENQTDMIAKVDLEGRLLFVSPSFCQTFGVTHEALTGSSFLELIHDEDRPRVSRALAALALPPHTAFVEVRARTRYGLRWQSWRNAAIPQRDGDVEAIVATGRDVTERKHAERELRESEERFRRLAENAKDIIFRNSLPDGAYEYVSPAAEEVTGYAPQEFYQSESLPRGLIHPDWIAYYEREWEKVLAGDMSPSYEYQIIHKSGEERWVSHRNVLIRDEAGTPVAMEGIVSDVTEYKRVEQELKRLNEELEDRVRMRTAQFEAANKELEAFAYSVSHDLRAPLRGIDGFSEALIEDYQARLSGDALVYLEHIRRNTVRMGQLIEDLLHLSRVARVEMSVEQVDLSELASAVAAELLREAPDRKVDLRIEQRLEARGDPRLLRVLMRNLLENAWKFTSERAQAIVTFGATEIDGVRAFYIRDNGAGFDMRYVGKLFGAFQRLHSESEFEGTGVGLATVQRIIARHGGRVWAEGGVDQGATFYFTL